MENEKSTERFLCKEVKRLGGKAYKWVSPGCSGVPDRLVILPGGHVFFVELKSEGRESTVQQQNRQAEIAALGCTVYPDIDTKDKVRRLLEREVYLRGISPA